MDILYKDSNGDITLGSDISEVKVLKNGEIIIKRGSGVEESIGIMTLTKFANPSGLESKGSNLYYETAASGEALIPEDKSAGSIMQRTLETSNVQVVEEMIKSYYSTKSI